MIKTLNARENKTLEYVHRWGKGWVGSVSPVLGGCFLLWFLTYALAPAQAAAPPMGQAKLPQMDAKWKKYNADIVKLIDKLGDEKQTVREEAYNQLLQVGSRAVYQFRFSNQHGSRVWKRSALAFFGAIQDKHGIQPIVEAGMEFRPFADRNWRIPAPGGKQRITFGLKVTNLSRERTRFCLVDTVFPVLIDSDGEVLKKRMWRDHLRVAPQATPPLGKGESYSISDFGAYLYKSPDSREIWLEGETASGSCFAFDDLKPGRYYLWFACKTDLLPKMKKYNGFPIWKGETATPYLAVEVK